MRNSHKLPAGLLSGVLLFSAAHGDSPTSPEPLSTEPWREAVLSVRDLREASRFFLEAGGFERIANGRIDSQELHYWQLPEGSEGDFLLVRAPGTDHGFLRFVRFSQVEQVPIRVGARAWDSGGYFSLMMRASGLDSLYADALAMGWLAESEPVQFDFPPSVLANVVLKGPDGINVALYERLEPPLDEFWQFERLSQPFNAMQMVAEIDRADAFFTWILGMSHFWAGDYIDPAPGPNNFGLPQNLTTEIPRRTRILQMFPGESGRLELMQFVGLDGRDLSARAKPPNLGIVSVRFPVPDLELAIARIETAGGEIWRGPADLELPPYGRVRMLAVRAPDGAIVELFAPADRDPAAELARELSGQFDNSAQFDAAPEALKVPPSVDGDWLDLQYAAFAAVDAPAIGEHVLYLEWRSGGPEGSISRQRIWSFRQDDSGTVRMDFFAFVDGADWAGRADEPGAFDDLSPADLRGYGPDCALRFDITDDGGWRGEISAEECSLVASSGRRMGIDAGVSLSADGELRYRESGRLDSGQYAFRVPPTQPYIFKRRD